MSAPLLSLHHLTALGLTPLALIDLAEQLGCSHVGLFTGLPPGIATEFPCVTPDTLDAVAEKMAATGVALNNAEVFALRQEIDLSVYQPSIARAARLGARVVTTHVHEHNPQHAHYLLEAFADQVAERGMRVALEFTSFSACRSLLDALTLLERVDHPGLCLAVDALHFFRNQGQCEQLIQVPPSWIGYVQLCDGPQQVPKDLYHEAVVQRQIPGEGEFPLVQMLKNLVATTLVDVEVPKPLATEGVAAIAAHAGKAVTAARNIMYQAGWH
jgi:sugar phosphate isomerase/epimerase